MTATQAAKARRATAEYKAWIKSLKVQMKALKAEGKEFSHLAVCPDSYAVYLKLKF